KNLPQNLTLGAGGGNWEERLIVAALEPWLTHACGRLEQARPAEYRARSRAFLDVLDGDADGSRYANVMDLFQNLVGVAGRLNLVPNGHPLDGLAKRRQPLLWRTSPPPACTSAVVWGDATDDGRMLHARNFDFPGIGVWDTEPTVTFCSPNTGLKYGYVGTRGADVPGVTAFNEAGIVVTAHTRLHKHVRFDGRTLVDLGHEVVRTCDAIDAAIALITSTPVASAWGICISSARERRAVVIETTGRASAVVSPERYGVLTCSNLNRDTALQRDEICFCAGWTASSNGRERVMRRGIEREWGSVTPQTLSALLGSQEDPDVEGYTRTAGPIPAQACSVQSVVVDAQNQRIWVSVGACPTGLGGWVPVPWEWDTGATAIASSGAEAACAREAGVIAYTEATRLAQLASPVSKIANALEVGTLHNPDDPSLLFMLGGAALSAGEPSRALAFFERALGSERNPGARVRLHAWAARAAVHVSRDADARRHRDAVAADTSVALSRVRHDVRREQRAPLSMSKLRRTKLALELLDLVVG
ncbi:MAG: hypothetical protein ACJA1R_002901, partial [Flavobacteriales bacterium]